jgi:hypothetical protein
MSIRRVYIAEDKAELVRSLRSAENPTAPFQPKGRIASRADNARFSRSEYRFASTSKLFAKN